MDKRISTSQFVVNGLQNIAHPADIADIFKTVVDAVPNHISRGRIIEEAEEGMRRSRMVKHRELVPFNDCADARDEGIRIAISFFRDMIGKEPSTDVLVELIIQAHDDALQGSL